MIRETVVDWVEVHVVHVGAVIALVTNGMFPETLLPNSAAIAQQGFWPRRFDVREGFGEAQFNGAPAARIIGVAFRQGPDSVHVVRQDHPGIDMEGFS